ncbi:AMP-binding protein, partial [Actinoplanes sp. KI2]|uniref:AMP-binding protein n=1 Tax=Actinoplanes sp. KI2 TaxID=2983315 RepID=UPI0021D5D71D
EQAEIRFPGMQARFDDAPTTQSRFDLTFVLNETFDAEGRPAGLSGEVEFAVDLFDVATVQGLSRWFGRVLEGLVERPDAAVGEVSLLSQAERDVVVREWNETGAGVPVGTFPQLFQAQVDADGSAPAVVFGSQELSYGQLASRVDAFAARLAAAGVGAESVVAVALPRSVDLVVALLGVLRAGGAYLPVDPDYPAERVEFMLTDAAPVLLVTDRVTQSRLPWVDGLPVLLADDEPVGPAGAVPPLPVEVRHPAYVIYTSGSTGRPKGVVVTHGGLAALSQAQQSVLGVGPGSRVLQFAALSFDAAAWEIVMGLLSGAT